MPARRQVKAGQRFGRWVAAADGYYVDHAQLVECVCDCGTKRVVSAGNLKQRERPSCGCSRAESIAKVSRKPVSVGSRFGRLTVSGEPVYGRKPFVPCVCDCGSPCTIPQKCLQRKNYTKSCGCLQRERSSAAAARDISKRATLNRVYAGPRGAIRMRSSWEVAVAHRLDRDGLEWDYEPQTFALAENVRYTPDFRVNLGVYGTLWIEVKGEFFGKSREKAAAFAAAGNALLIVGKDNFNRYTGLTPREAHQMYPAVAA